MSTTFTFDAKEHPEYVLRRDYAAAARLNLQHYQYTKAIGYLLDSEILSLLPKDAKIADIAAGSGIWLLDLADQVPATCTLEGWDISDESFPGHDTLPSNVRFGILDATKPLSDELEGKYDVVHVGLLALVVKDGDPGIWLKNIYNMLKPGGYLQWMEGDIPRFIQRIKARRSPQDRFPAMHAFESMNLAQMASPEATTSAQWITDLEQHFEKYGFVDVKSVSYEVPKKYWRAWTETLLLIGEEMADQLKNRELEKLLKAVGAEISQGATNPTLFPKVVIGKKLK